MTRTSSHPAHPGDAAPAIVVGSGLAGLATALELAPMPVVLVTRGRLDTPGSTAWAQGGLAAALGPDDSPLQHARDTVAAAAGLGDPQLAAEVAAAAPQAVARLRAWGVAFDRGPDGRERLGREAAHSRARVLHLNGDGSGAGILAALIRSVRATPSIRVLEYSAATALLQDDQGRVAGVRLRRHGRPAEDLPGRAVVLATGGAGGLFAATTNPLAAWGAGLWLAGQAGAVLRDLEFVQVHPTALDLPADPLPLASEALRGAGVRLVDGSGAPLSEDGAAIDLAPRDVVARAVAGARAAGRSVCLDTPGAVAAGLDLAARFPGFLRRCRAAGLDPLSRPVPVRPAAHYHMGGIKVDGRGRSSVPGLWACGEVACTGLHGANRLASNSLLEAVVFAAHVAADVAGAPAQPPATSAAPAGPDLPPAADVGVRRVLDRALGPVRDGAGLRRALVALAAHQGPDAELARVFAVAALRRPGSVGAHVRSDADPAARPRAAPRGLTLAQARRLAAEHCEEATPYP
jgi:L-aspartate oxidase